MWNSVQEMFVRRESQLNWEAWLEPTDPNEQPADGLRGYAVVKVRQKKRKVMGEYAEENVLLFDLNKAFKKGEKMLAERGICSAPRFAGRFVEVPTEYFSSGPKVKMLGDGSSTASMFANSVVIDVDNVCEA